MTDEAKRVRMALVEMHHKAQTGHLGGALSMVEILLAVHGKGRVIVSKGHAISAWYAVCAERHQRDWSAGGAASRPLVLKTFNQRGSKLPEQPAPDSYGVTWATGSLGHGLSVGLGFALADKLKGDPTRTFVVMSDGECQEGSVWEAAMLAPVLNLSNLTVIVDANGWQATSPTLGDNHRLGKKFQSFGWRVSGIDGQTPPELRDALNRYATPALDAIIAYTRKGAGIPFIEADGANNWHYRHPSEADVERARRELGL